MKKFLLFCSIFCFASLVVQSSLHARLKTTKPHWYVSFPQMFNLHTKAKTYDITNDPGNPNANPPVPPSEKHVHASYTYDLFSAQFLSSIVVGYMYLNSLGVEFEINSYDLFSAKVDGSVIKPQDSANAFNTVDYMMFNVRKDAFSYGSINAFYKVGFGFLQQNIPSLAQNGGYDLTPAVQGVLGTYYAVNDYIDVEAYYKFLMNYSKLKLLNTIGYKHQGTYNEGSINFAVRFKIHSLEDDYKYAR